jgi:hypothetical protein
MQAHPILPGCPRQDKQKKGGGAASWFMIPGNQETGATTGSMYVRLDFLLLVSRLRIAAAAARHMKKRKREEPGGGKKTCTRSGCTKSSLSSCFACSFAPACGPYRDQTTPVCDICSKKAESGARRPALLCQPIITHTKPKTGPEIFLWVR